MTSPLLTNSRTKVARACQRLQASSAEQPNGCILWTGAKASGGYGSMWFDGRSQLTHRVAWQAAHGLIPAGKFVLHRCDNPPCINVRHLFLGTQDDNMKDCAIKGRTCRGDQSPTRTRPERYPRGEAKSSAKLTEAQVIQLRLEVSQGASIRGSALRYGVSAGTARAIVQRRKWRHV